MVTGLATPWRDREKYGDPPVGGHTHWHDPDDVALEDDGNTTLLAEIEALVEGYTAWGGEDEEATRKSGLRIDHV